MISGGIFSTKDGLHTVQMNAKEIGAVVEAANAWDTYVTCHVSMSLTFDARSTPA